MHTFESLRKDYPVFAYDGYHIGREPGGVRLRFDFSVEGLCAFHPETFIRTDSLTLLNAFDSAAAQAIVFSLGLTEAVSYYKAVCSPVMDVRCGALTDEQIRWWKKLWFHGLGEFFYRNGIETTEEDFVTVRCAGTWKKPCAAFRSAGLHIVPIGGGKDSAVTLSLLQNEKDRIYGFTVNDQRARTDTMTAAGLPLDRMIRTHRTITPNCCV